MKWNSISGKRWVMGILLIIAFILVGLWLIGFIAIPGLWWVFHIVLIAAIIVFGVWLLHKVLKLF
jgi:hypothetical protein